MAIVALVKAAGTRAHVVFEEETHAQWLHDVLTPHPEHVSVCDIRGRRSETTNKSDRIDADWLGTASPRRIGRTSSSPTTPCRNSTACVETDRTHACLTVVDDGTGIAPDVLDQIFEPLFTTKRSGTGLGLAVAQQIIVQHRGTIEVTSTFGEGTNFRIVLPLAE